MKEYIEKAAVENMLETAQLISDGEYCGYCTEDVSLNSIPAAEVAEVRHGRWIVHFDHFAPYQKCSVCGFEIPLVATENEAEMCFYKHCPECTARMDKEDEHKTS